MITLALSLPFIPAAIGGYAMRPAKTHAVRAHVRRETETQREQRDRLLRKLEQLRVEIMERDLCAIVRADVERETA
ncbi:hypothetical protein [Pararhizobium mangrovi]|uniref:Uncharacterized protein n=1 Tax=Pararhizobium mangrovi TaxID=2590452 RepID=A0A506U1H2_9HYPH|nr:hypothetical protein [Pararhizobium mangrovi]TPW26844.1 hypothetical protein FJU11_13645 [Pararhizobium mangrovi]